MGSQYIGETIFGYYEISAFDKLVEDIQPYDKDSGTTGIYTTLHAVNPDCLYRSRNRLREAKRKDTTTSDHHITHFLGFPIDLDAERVSGISASQAELDQACEKAKKIAEVFEELEIPFIKALSGNGYHILILIEAFENNEKNAARFKNLGDRVAAHFGTDTSIYNPSRIWKLYGTIARKGDNTEERPHRRAQIWLPDEIQRITFNDLEERLNSRLPAVEPPPKQEKKRQTIGKQDITLEEWLNEHNVEYQKKKQSNGTIKYTMDCPFNSDHKAPDAAVIDTGKGWAFKCFHDSCQQHGWSDFKAKVAPDTGTNIGEKRKRTNSAPETPKAPDGKGNSNGEDN